MIVKTQRTLKALAKSAAVLRHEGLHKIAAAAAQMDGDSGGHLAVKHNDH